MFNTRQISGLALQRVEVTPSVWVDGNIFGRPYVSLAAVKEPLHHE